MTEPNKPLTGVILRSFCAVALGVVIVYGFVSLLSLYGVSQEKAPTVTARALKFPENEKQLDNISEQLAREGAALSAIAPAAGDVTPPTTPKKSAP